MFCKIVASQAVGIYLFFFLMKDAVFNRITHIFLTLKQNKSESFDEPSLAGGSNFKHHT